MYKFLFFTVLLWFGSPPQVDSVGLLSPIWGLKNIIFGAPGPAPEESSLVLAVETSGRIYFANKEFVTSQMNDIYSKFVFACPAEPDTAQAEINEVSKTKKALFIEKIYDKPKKPAGRRDFIEHKCRRPVEPSVIHAGSYEGNDDIDLYLIGYEVFIEKNIESYKIDVFYEAVAEDKRFVWFNVYTVAFDRKRGNVVNTFSPMLAYKTDDDLAELGSSTATEVAEKDYSYGEETFFHRHTPMEEFYGKENQIPMFKYFFDDSAPMKYVDLVQGRYLGAVYLVPPENFVAPFLQITSETYGNIAPMWIMVYNNSWIKLETHIEYLAKGLKAIHLITGTYGTLKLSDKEIFLAPGGGVKVPAAFFKIVSYSPNENEKYNMLFVVSNNPFNESDRVNELICEHNHCKKFGWENVQQDFFAMGRTSCCELTMENLRKLEMRRMDKLIDKPLNLAEVPHWKENHLSLDLKAYILNQINDDYLDKPADDEMYKNDKSVVVEHQDDEVVFSKAISIMHANYVQPFFSKKMDRASD